LGRFSGGAEGIRTPDPLDAHSVRSSNDERLFIGLPGINQVAGPSSWRLYHSDIPAQNRRRVSHRAFARMSMVGRGGWPVGQTKRGSERREEAITRRVGTRPSASGGRQGNLRQRTGADHARGRMPSQRYGKAGRQPLCVAAELRERYVRDKMRSEPPAGMRSRGNYHDYMSGDNPVVQAP